MTQSHGANVFRSNAKLAGPPADPDTDVRLGINWWPSLLPLSGPHGSRGFEMKAPQGAPAGHQSLRRPTLDDRCDSLHARHPQFDERQPPSAPRPAAVRLMGDMFDPLALGYSLFRQQHGRDPGGRSQLAES